MSPLGLSTVSLSLALLLALSGSRSGAAARCLDAAQVNERVLTYEQRYWSKVGHALQEHALRHRAADTCAQAAEDSREEGLRGRSLSPWSYRLNRVEDRFPAEIIFAACLCQGCIIKQREDLSYNSTPIFIRLKVLKKTRCQGAPEKYAVTKEFISVPVGCTCVRPKVTTSM